MYATLGDLETYTVKYERVKDTIWHGILGDFKLVIDRRSNAFNATQLGEATSKPLSDWMNSVRTNSFIDYYIRLNPHSSYYELLSEPIAGMYMCKDLLLSFAAWIGLDVYDKCSRIIADYVAKGYDKEDPPVAVSALDPALDEFSVRIQKMKDALASGKLCKDHAEQLLNEHLEVTRTKEKATQTQDTYRKVKATQTQDTYRKVIDVLLRLLLEE